MIASYNLYRLIPVPTKKDIDGVGETVDVAGVEVILNAQAGDGWMPMWMPFDMYQPAIIFTKRVERNLDEQVEQVLERIADIDTWAPESGIDADQFYRIGLRTPLPDLKLIIQATLAVK